MTILENFFKLNENNTNIKTEIIAGITIFLAMAYILIVNPTMLSETGMNVEGVFVATALSAAISTILLGLIANYPYALASGMGLNAFFTYIVVIVMGYSWEFGLLTIFVSGIFFLIISLTSLREKLFYTIPDSLRYGVSIGIGLFILALGLSNLGIISYSTQTLTLGTLPNLGLLDYSSQLIGLGRFSTIFTIPNLLALFCLILILILMKFNVKGYILIGIITTYFIGVICELGGFPILSNQSLIPNTVVNTNVLGTLSTVAFHFSNVGNLLSSFKYIVDFLIIALTFLVISLFDTMGTLTALATKIDAYDDEGKLPRLRKVLAVDSLGPMIGAALGISSVVTYIESSTGIISGGRTGLTAVVVGILFLLAIFFGPIFTIIPTFAVAPALIVVGIAMFSLYKHLDTKNLSEFIPALITVVTMPLTQSITSGIIAGVFSFVIVKAIYGKFKDISNGMWVLFIFLLVYMGLEFIL